MDVWCRLRECVSQLLVAVDKIPEINTYKVGRFTLVRGFGPWSLDSDVFRPVARWNIMEGSMVEQSCFLRVAREQRETGAGIPIPHSRACPQ